MQTYIALLRGINVGGQKKITMKPLAEHVQSLGWRNVQTYLQSGNVVFSAKKISTHSLQQTFEDMINRVYGFEVPVVIRTAKEWEAVVNANPFTPRKGKDPAKMYVTFLADKPNTIQSKTLQSVNYPPEEFLLQDRHIYLYSPNGYGKAKCNNQFFENKLKINATTRNWNSVMQLMQLASA